MDSPGPGRPATRPKRAIALPILGAGVVLIVVAGVAIYAGRDRIAEGLARRWLSADGVASDLHLQALSLTGFSATVRLGDPNDPDLVVERIDVGYALAGPWSGKPFAVQTRALRLVRPRLKLRLSRGHLSFGALDPLIRQLTAHPTSGAPLPDITIEDGFARLLTDGGDAQFRGSGEIRRGALVALTAAVDPFRISAFGGPWTGAGATLTVSRSGGRLLAKAALGALGVQVGDRQVRATQSVLQAELPYPRADGSWHGPAKLSVAVTGAAASAGDVGADGAILNADAAGDLDTGGDHQSFSGDIHMAARLASLLWRGARASDAAAQLGVTSATLIHTAAGLSFSGGATAGLTTGGVAGPAAQLTSLNAAAQLTSLRLQTRPDFSLVSASGAGSLTGGGGFTPMSAHALAEGAPALSSDAAYASAVKRGLRAFRFDAGSWRADFGDHTTRLQFAAPAKVETASGARLILADSGAAFSLGPKGGRGNVNLSLEGGGLPSFKAQIANASLSGAGGQADIGVQAALDTALARGATARISGRLTKAGSSLRFDLAGCAPITATRLAMGPNAVAGFAASLCPGAGPLVATGPSGWAAQGRFQDVKGDVSGFAATISGASGAFQLAGGCKGPKTGGPSTGDLTLDQTQIADSADPIRFKPLRLHGRMNLARGAWTGGFAAATLAGHPIAEIRIRHAMATGVGRADIDAGGLTFASGGLQPAELTPLAGFARDANGPAAFKGWFAWGRGGAPTSGGDLTAKNLTFKSPMGPVLDIDADLHFVSLSPLVTAPGQSITIAQVQAITPLSGLSMAFELGADAIKVNAAGGGVAGGRIALEPLTAALAPGSVFKGVLLVDHVDIGQMLAASSLADAVQMTAVVNGRIPFEVGPSGLTIQQGSLAAVAPGRLSISRKALTGAAAMPTGQAGFAQNIAYQAMEDLAFDQLDAALNTQASDRLGILFHIKGRHDPPEKQRAVISISDVIHGKALDKPISLPSDTKIDLTLDTSLNFGELVRALEQAWRDSMPSAEDLPRSGPVQGAAPTVTNK